MHLCLRVSQLCLRNEGHVYSSPSPIEDPRAECGIERECSPCFSSVGWGSRTHAGQHYGSVSLWGHLSQIWPLICDQPFSGTWGWGQGKTRCCPGAALSPVRDLRSKCCPALSPAWELFPGGKNPVPESVCS